MKKARRHSCMMHNSTQPRYMNKTKENLGPNALGANKETNRKTLHTNHVILQWAAAQLQLNQGWSSWWEFVLWTKPLESKLLPRCAIFYILLKQTWTEVFGRRNALMVGDMTIPHQFWSSDKETCCRCLHYCVLCHYKRLLLLRTMKCDPHQVCSN